VTGRLDGRLIGLGVTGSIAAYKAVELLRLLRAEGADVAVMLTPSATRFVGALSFAALSRHPVETDVLDLLPDGRIGHIVIADSVDAIVVAPATAHWLGAMAGGLAADAVAAACLASSAPIVVAPAMDGDMWAHPATQDNVDRLHERFGYTVVPPGAGELASGQSGVGRLAELETIVDAVVAAVAGRPVRLPDPAGRPPLATIVARDTDLDGRHVVVTAGGTREPIDPVRYIGNRSTGRMGVAVADAALARGARVTLIAANLEVPPPPGADVQEVHSTADLETALYGVLSAAGGEPGFDALVMAAAVADFRPASPSTRKLPRSDGLTLTLEATPDLLAGVSTAIAGAAGPRPVIVGFAAETGALDRVADKLARKGVDLLVANDVTSPGSGFGTATNQVTVFGRDGSSDAWPLATKREVADRLLDLVVAALDERDRDAQTSR
jgi:phosphopantothenoylcysteine decarboxylase / phosphopantothenate---cysteine ligase